jgi:hypothetical protein
VQRAPAQRQFHSSDRRARNPPPGTTAEVAVREERRTKHQVRLLNPEPKTASGRHHVAVLNPGSLAELDRAGAMIRFWDFRGREPKGSVLMEARPATPATVAELGGLVELVIDIESVRWRTIKPLGVKLKTNDDGNLVWKFNPAKVKLAADFDCELHIVGYYRARPNDLRRGVSHKIGAVAAVTYKADKPHLHEGVKDYEHRFAEGGGEFPRLFYKEGYIFFRGGTYSLSAEGIEG